MSVPFVSGTFFILHLSLSPKKLGSAASAVRRPLRERPKTFRHFRFISLRPSASIRGFNFDRITVRRAVRPDPSRLKPDFPTKNMPDRYPISRSITLCSFVFIRGSILHLESRVLVRIYFAFRCPRCSFRT